jgi:ABC-type nitrate/sulfonate/bicarbonate transport system substrate-binding protein
MRSKQVSFKLAIAICVSAVFIVVPPSMVSAQQMPKISIGVSSGSLPGGGARIAKQMGLFEKHGLDATVITMDNAGVATMGVIPGSLHFWTGAPTDVILSTIRGQDLVAITGVYRGFAGVLVLSKAVAEKSGISAAASVNERLKALDKLVIAAPSATSTFTFSLKAAAEAVGAKVSFTYMAQDAMFAALERGAVQGFVAGAPFYGQPVLSNSGVIWLNGPKGEFPAQYVPVNAVTLNAKRDFATANPDVVKRASAAIADLAKAAEERPADVKAAIAALYPTLTPQTLELLFDSESIGFKTAKPLTSDEIAREIAYMKSSGIDLPQIEPGRVLLP